MIWHTPRQCNQRLKSRAVDTECPTTTAWFRRRFPNSILTNSSSREEHLRIVRGPRWSKRPKSIEANSFHVNSSSSYGKAKRPESTRDSTGNRTVAPLLFRQNSKFKQFERSGAHCIGKSTLIRGGSWQIMSRMSDKSYNNIL